jgi:hypothetical protein
VCAFAARASHRFDGRPAPKSLTATFSAAEQGYRAVFDSVGAHGSKGRWEYTANFDGKPYPVFGNPGADMVVVTRIDAVTTQSSYTLKGKPTIVNTRVVSADGKTLTLTTVGVMQGQQVNNVQVFEKKESPVNR